MRSINRKNAGITLVEILVVVCILSIVVGISSISISLVFSRDAERCAKTINTALENIRMNSMSRRGDYSLVIDRVNNQITRTTPNGNETEQLAGRVQISFESADYDLSGTNVLTIVFDKSTGKVAGYQTNNTPVQGEEIGLLRIRCTNESGSKVATVVLVRNTGKHYVEYGS